ncbi:DNA-binding response regulator [Paenibacillus marchantiophytorum]|uniref:DNA-binding response regulator n=1 Tax=Paenibacillus marchantiophytorum TaxID=1619310 RepID=A0ABQ1EKK3_9BACL|nr:response regulator transcription factor [Paenibacillus marchantiophytorum]GFZ75859.1 DNA-binding response regulator [Paenibacillus marchantiophytorum]
MDKIIRILVVEDDNDINQLLCKILKKSGYSPQAAYSGTEAMIYLERQEWDMVLLDLMLPGLSGEELLMKINEQSSIPVIVISAKEEKQTKVATLRIGADDYITKPFDIEEVSARIDSHLRRYSRLASIVPSHLVKYKNISLDKDTKLVTINQIEVILTAIEFAILELFISYPKKVFSKANLFESVWGETFVGGDNTINVHISNLRNKLSKANPEMDYIETLWGMGYRLK